MTSSHVIAFALGALIGVGLMWLVEQCWDDPFNLEYGDTSNG